MSKVVFKQWIYQPNKKRTPKTVGAMLEYIATRLGVELGGIDLKNEFNNFNKELSLQDELYFLKQIDYNAKKATGVYIDYIATRPGVATQNQPHGLFGKLKDMPQMNDIENLSATRNYVENLAENKTTIYNAVISLKEEDAIAKDLTDKESWSELVNKYINDIARGMGIPPRTLEWVGAVHMEKDHPHVHIMYWDNDQKIVTNYINPELSNSIRKDIAKDLFRDDIRALMTEKDLIKKGLMSKVYTGENSILKNSVNVFKTMSLSEIYKSAHEKEKVHQILNRRIANGLVDDVIIDLQLLDEKISELYPTGALKYKYLPEKLKQSLDELSIKIIKNNPDIEKEVALYINKAKQQAAIYGGRKNTNYYADKEKRSLYTDIGNKILDTIKSLRSQNHTILNNQNTDLQIDSDDLLNQEVENSQVSDFNEIANILNVVDDQPKVKSRKVYSEDKSVYIEWSELYKKAKKLLNSDPPDFDKSFLLFMSEMENGNALAMYDIASFYTDGLGIDINKERALKIYSNALSAFKKIADVKFNAYLEYRIGKMYLSGLGTEQDHNEASLHLRMSADNGYKFAQYTLGSMYYKGQGVEQSFEEAFSLYTKSHKNNFCYASYELAKMHQEGIGTNPNKIKANECYRVAYKGFCCLEAESHDDKLQYRIGMMLLNGLGTEKNVVKAAEYFEKSAQLNNAFAQYQLAKLWLADGDITPEKREDALKWLLRSANEGENQYAQYALGKFYLKGEDFEKDIDKAITQFTASADQGNQFAQYSLGKLYLEGEDIDKDINKAVTFLTASANQGNQFAQYTLGKLLLKGEVIPQNISESIRLLAASANQCNQFAQYALGKLLLKGEVIPQNIIEAIKLLTLSAEQGNQFAQYTLGKTYYQGKLLPKNKEEGLRWLTLSAQQGNIYAQSLISNKNTGLIINLMQDVLNICTQSNSTATNKNKRMARDMSKAEKSELLKKTQDNSLEWSD